MNDDVNEKIYDQYIVSAILMDDVIPGSITTSKIIDVLTDENKAMQHDVSSYKDTEWMVLLEHVKISATGSVIGHIDVRVLHPIETSNSMTRFDA